MARRYIIVAVVFLVCFGLGYGATWLVVGSPDKPPAPVVAEAPPAREPTNAPEASSAPPASAPSEVDAHVAEDDVAAELDTNIAAAPDSAPSDEPDSAAPALEEATPPTSDAWWDQCKGKVCIIDWGRVSGGISVREGKIEHGAEIDWAADFAKADKVGTLEAKKNMKVEVLGIGMTDGKPVAAWIKYKNIAGVIALSIGDKAISFSPVAQ